MSVWRIVLGFLMLSSLIASFGAQDREKDGANKEEKQNATAQYFYKFPPNIQIVLKDSIVGVEVSSLSMWGGVRTTKVKSATGFSVGNSLIITSLHTFSDAPQTWFPSKIRICDGQNFFNAKLVAVDPLVDLALILIVDEERAKFSKKAVTFASSADKQNIPDHFFSFAFSTVGREIYFPMELGRYLMETNLIGSEILPLPLGVVSGNVEEGFSGAPLIGPDGKIYGVLSRKSDAYVYVTTLEQIPIIIKESKSELEKEAKEAAEKLQNKNSH